MKKNKSVYFWIAIILVAILDAFSTTIIGIFPALGDILSGINNLIWEVIELALIFGLVKYSKK